MKIAQTTDGDIVTLVPTGELDEASCPQLEQCLDAHCQPRRPHRARPAQPELHGRRRRRAAAAHLRPLGPRGLGVRRPHHRRALPLAPPPRRLDPLLQPVEEGRLRLDQLLARLARAGTTPPIDLRELLRLPRARRPLHRRTCFERTALASTSPSAAHAVTTLRFFWRTSPSSTSSPRLERRPDLLLELAQRGRPAAPRRRRTRPSGSTRRRRRAWPRTDRRGARAAPRGPSAPRAVEEDAGAAPQSRTTTFPRCSPRSMDGERAGAASMPPSTTVSASLSRPSAISPLDLGAEVRLAVGVVEDDEAAQDGRACRRAARGCAGRARARSRCICETEPQSAIRPWMLRRRWPPRAAGRRRCRSRRRCRRAPPRASAAGTSSW